MKNVFNPFGWILNPLLLLELAVLPFWAAAVPAIISAVGSVAGGLIGKQKAPKAEPFIPVDPQEEQRRALEGNLANSNRIEQLQTRANAFTQDQALSLTEKAIPGYGKMVESFMKVGQENMTNPYALPSEVEQNLTRIAGERGINTGIRGQAGDFSLLRDFGVNSLQYGQARISQAQQLFQTVASMAPRVNPMSPMSLYVTPQQQVDAKVQNNTGQRSTQQAANNAATAARNHNASMWGQMVSDFGGKIAGAYAGKKSPSGGGGGGGDEGGWF